MQVELILLVNVREDCLFQLETEKNGDNKQEMRAKGGEKMACQFCHNIEMKKHDTQGEGEHCRAA